MERSALDVLDESDDDVYHAKQPSTKRSVERDGASACVHDLEAARPSRSERLQVNRRGRSRLCLGSRLEEAIGRARDKEVKECLGAAWHRRLSRDNCRYWTGGRDEFLPADGLRSDGDGEWDLAYL